MIVEITKDTAAILMAAVGQSWKEFLDTLQAEGQARLTIDTKNGPGVILTAQLEDDDLLYGFQLELLKDTFKVGDRVTALDYGPGTVSKIKEDTYTIDFDSGRQETFKFCDLKKLKSTFEIGNHVRHKEFGLGTVTIVTMFLTYPYQVRFENGEIGAFIAKDLELVTFKIKDRVKHVRFGLGTVRNHTQNQKYPYLVDYDDGFRGTAKVCDLTKQGG